MSIVKSNGDVHIPEPLRERFNITSGTIITFLEQDGKIILARDDRGMLALESFCNEIRQEAREQGITEQDLLDELEQVREDMWNERKHKYVPNSD